MLEAAAIFVATFVGSLALLVAIVAALPERYFVSDERYSDKIKSPYFRGAIVVGKNVLGACLIALGVVLSAPLMPGQGLITIVIGLMLVDFPGKHRLVRRIIARPGVVKTLNRMRAALGRRPFSTER